MRIVLVAVLATAMCAQAGVAQTSKEKSPQATSSVQPPRQLSPAERMRCKQAPQALNAASRRACRSIEK
jgi:hypothetical protein